MWIDGRGSEVLALAECHRLLALGARQGLHGHLGLAGDGAPVVEPLDYAVSGHDVVVRVGDGLCRRAAGELVAFLVDGVGGAATVAGDEHPWSVLVRGLAIAEDPATLGPHVPVPRVAEPGSRVLRIRADVVSGRRLRAPADPPGAPRRAS